MNLDGMSDVVDPASEDWRSMDEAAVWHAAQAGIPEAQAEMTRRLVDAAR